MPTAIQNVVDKVAELGQSTPERIEKLIHANFCGLLAIISRFMKSEVDYYIPTRSDHL